jgi:hypothetical protein
VLNVFLYAVKGVGVVFIGVSLTAHLLDLRDVHKDVVYQKKPVFRVTPSVLGGLFLASVLAALLLAVIVRKKQQI